MTVDVSGRWLEKQSFKALKGYRVRGDNSSSVWLAPQNRAVGPSPLYWAVQAVAILAIGSQPLRLKWVQLLVKAGSRMGRVQEQHKGSIPEGQKPGARARTRVISLRQSWGLKPDVWYWRGIRARQSKHRGWMLTEARLQKTWYILSSSRSILGAKLISRADKPVANQGLRLLHLL